jgi:hypothetical protein
MNKLLAQALPFPNGLIAFVIIVIGTILGTVELHVLGLVTGAILGFIVALIVCGLIALFIEMHNELVKIRTALEQSGSNAG